jgi:MFS family permease
MQQDVQRQAGLIQGLVLSCITFLPILATVSLAAGMPAFREHFSSAAGAAWFVPMLLTVPALFIAAVSPIAGRLSDRFGRKRLLVAGLVVYGLSGLAPLMIDSLYFILATRAIVGISEGVLMTVGKSMVGDYFSGERRQAWVGYQGILDACLGSMTWLLGGVLASLGWRGPFLLYLIWIPLLAATFAFLWEPLGQAIAQPIGAAPASLGTIKPPASPTSAFPWGTMGVLYAITFATGLMYFSYPVNIAQALKDLGAGSSSNIGVVTAIASIGTPIGAYFYARSLRRSSPMLLTIALILIGVGFIGIGASHHYRLAAGFGFVEQIGNGIAGAVLVTWCLHNTAVSVWVCGAPASSPEYLLAHHYSRSSCVKRAAPQVPSLYWVQYACCLRAWWEWLADCVPRLPTPPPRANDFASPVRAAHLYAGGMSIPPSGSLPGFHLMLHPILGLCAAGCSPRKRASLA